MSELIPIALFAYARPEHLTRTLASLRVNQVPLIYAFSDAPKDSTKQTGVAQVRQILRSIDWCDVILIERAENWGTGRSILSGVSVVLEKHGNVIVFEDDLVCVPGTYEYLCSAMNHYRDVTQVMSVTGWTHSRVTPTDVSILPYFDGRAECWVWGAWARSWNGMGADAQSLMRKCLAQGIDPSRYGIDLPAMAQTENQANTWAVRWIYHHILQGGLCLRPPHTLVEHIGFDAQAARAKEVGIWASSPLQPCPAIPEIWPDPVENPQCAKLWQQAARIKPSLPSRVAKKLQRVLAQITRPGGVR